MKELLKKFEMDEAKEIDTPITTAIKLDMIKEVHLSNEKYTGEWLILSCISLLVELIYFLVLIYVLGFKQILKNHILYQSKEFSVISREPWTWDFNIQNEASSIS